jgi:hypothetical protein
MRACSVRSKLLRMFDLARKHLRIDLNRSLTRMDYSIGGGLFA